MQSTVCNAAHDSPVHCISTLTRRRPASAARPAPWRPTTATLADRSTTLHDPQPGGRYPYSLRPLLPASGLPAMGGGCGADPTQSPDSTLCLVCSRSHTADPTQQIPHSRSHRQPTGLSEPARPGRQPSSRQPSSRQPSSRQPSSRHDEAPDAPALSRTNRRRAGVSRRNYLPTYALSR